MDDKKLWATVGTLTLAEKAALCSGASAWLTKALPEKGIPALLMADGPHGLRLEDPKNKKANGGPSRRATCFPPEVTLACAWSPELTRAVGSAIAEECLEHGVGLILGPGVNIKRSPLCGRNFEYYSEDPLLAGELAAGFIEGAQGGGVGTSLKHFAVNNQERYRMSINAAVDERALFELYLKPFELA
ncbi:MAG: glycoside hydrolase family 3 N-terminal domain-containing protein, partial [Oscillospiraceae bacterium]